VDDSLRATLHGSETAPTIDSNMFHNVAADGGEQWNVVAKQRIAPSYGSQ
jgi:hypothetical protein